MAEAQFASTPGRQISVALDLAAADARLSSSTLTLVFDDSLTKDELSAHLDAIEVEIARAFTLAGSQAGALPRLADAPFTDGARFSDGAGWSDAATTEFDRLGG